MDFALDGRREHVGEGQFPPRQSLDNPKFLENLLHSLRREDIKCESQ